MKVDPGRVGRYSRAGWRWLRLLPPRRRRGLRVFYGHDRVPGPGEPVAGGSAKFQRLASRFPNDPTGFTVLYLGSTWLPRDLGPLLGLARRRSVPVVVNMDGVAYPGWAGERDGGAQRALPPGLTCRRRTSCIRASSRSPRPTSSSVQPPGSWEILHNAVDVNHFTPAAEPPPDGPVLLLGGDQTQAYRLELGLAHVRTRPRVRARSRACSSPAASSLGPSRSSTSSACAAGSTSSAATPSARRLTSCAARTSCCTRRCRTRARAS